MLDNGRSDTDFTDSEADVRGMRGREDGWDDGRRDQGSDNGWRAGPAGGGYGADWDGNGCDGNGYRDQGHGRPEHPGYGGRGPQEASGAGWNQPARDGASPGYAGQPRGGQVPGRIARAERGIQDSGFGGYPADGYRQQPNFRPGSGTPGEFSPREAPAPSRPQTPRPYGRLSIFTLLDDKTAEFDRLAEVAAEGVRTSEPDTLVYVIHVVPKAPMQRIIYEIYRDRVAFENHESQPHIQRFTEERKSCVLATNIIDLRLKYAKVAALFQGDQAGNRPVDAGSDYGVPGGDVVPPRSQGHAPRALEAGIPAAGAGYQAAGAGEPAAAGGYPGGQYGDDQYGGGQYAGGQYGGGQYGGREYGAGQYAGNGQWAGQYDGAGRYDGAGQYEGAGRYSGAGQYSGDAAGQYGGTSQYNQTDQYNQLDQYNGTSQYNGATQYNGAGQYNGADQYGGARHYNGAGHYNGAAQYDDGGQDQAYGGGAGGYDAPPGLGRGPAQKPAARPPWEEAPDWSPPYPGQRYGD